MKKRDTPLPTPPQSALARPSFKLRPNLCFGRVSGGPGVRVDCATDNWGLSSYSGSYCSSDALYLSLYHILKAQRK
jgi:hypothetical protein